MNHPHHHRKTQQRKQQQPPPSLYSIHRGFVKKIAPYGAFIKLPQPYENYSGLVHISQLCDARVEQVQDVVSAEDSVFVKVLEVQHEEPSDIREGADWRPPRVKLKLSMKYVDQNDGRDLDPSNEHQAHGGTNRGNSSAASRQSFSNVAGSIMADNLNSKIGMSTAMDPMARNLILKSRGGNRDDTNSARMMFNGYALVDEDEPAEFVPKPVARSGVNPLNESHSNAMIMSRGPSAHVNAGVAATSLSSRPTGRGRGSTLPAWMTNRDLREKVSEQTTKRNDLDSSMASSDDDDSSTYSRRKKKHRKPQKKKRSSSSRKERKRKSEKNSKRSHKRSSRKSRERKRSRYSDNESTGTYSSGFSGADHSDRHFSNVKEAKALIARLEGESSSSKRIKR